MLKNFTNGIKKLLAAPAPTAAAGYAAAKAPDAMVFTAMLTTDTPAEDPDLVLKLIGKKRKDLRQLETDDEISGAMQTRIDATCNVPIRLEPYDRVAKGIEANFMRHANTLNRQAHAAIGYGYSVIELVYGEKLDGLRLGIKHTRSLPIELFEPNNFGGWLFKDPAKGGVWRELSPEELTFKFFITVSDPSATNPYGEALYSRLYWPWFFRVNLWRFRMNYLERYIDPLLIGKVHQPAEFVKAMEQQGFGSAVGVGVEEDVTAISPSGVAAYETAEQALIDRVHKMINGQKNASGQNGGGSFAAAKVADGVRMDKRDAGLRLLQGVDQRIVNALTMLNYAGAAPPVVVMADGRGLEIDRADRDAKLVTSGALALTSKYFVDNYDFEEGDFTIAAPMPAVKSAPSNKQLQLRDTRGRRRFTDVQQHIEDEIEELLEGVPDLIDPALIKAAVMAASDPQDLVQRLALLIDARNPEFGDVITRAMFAADAIGYVAAEENRT